MRPKRSLPQARARVLVAVIHHWARTGRAPTVREIGMATGLRATSRVHLLLDQLRTDGLITWDEGLSGTIRPTMTIRKVS